MSDRIHCPRCPRGRLHPFRKVNAEEERYIASAGRSGAHGYWRCEGRTSLGQCLWVQPYFNQRDGLSLPASFS